MSIPTPISLPQKSTSVPFSLSARLIPLLSALEPAAPVFASRLAARALFMPVGRRRSSRGDAFLATGAREQHMIAGRRIVAWRWSGTAAAAEAPRPLVVCLHGWAGSAAQFAQIVPALVARGQSVVAFDGPGHGHSSGRESSILQLRDTLVALGAREREPIAIVAHSGGAAAAALAIRDGLRARRLAFVGPTIDPAALLEQHALAAGFSMRLLAGVKRRTEKQFGMPWSALRVLPVAATRTEPLLVVHDRDDADVPWQEGADLVDAWPRARLLLTRGLGHRRVLYDAVVADTIAAFISDGSHEENKPATFTSHRDTEAQRRRV